MMMMMIRSTLILFIDIIFYELCSVVIAQLHACDILTNILLARNQYLLSPNPYLKISMFLALLYVMGLATTVSIQLGPLHPTPNIFQLTCPYLTHISNYLLIDILHTYDRLLDLQQYILILNKMFFFVSQQQHKNKLQFCTYIGIYVPCT